MTSSLPLWHLRSSPWGGRDTGLGTGPPSPAAAGWAGAPGLSWEAERGDTLGLVGGTLQAFNKSSAAAHDSSLSEGGTHTRRALTQLWDNLLLSTGQD